jgi:galactokinase
MVNQENLIIYDNDLKYEQEFEDNLQSCKDEFIKTFGQIEKGDIISVCAPGRVNLIGEHVDYNDGFVLPMAIPLYTIIVGSKTKTPQDNVCRIKTINDQILNESNYEEFNLKDIKPIEPVVWSSYVKGIVALFDGHVEPFNAVIKSNVPIGSGLSSSAALEVSMYTFLENLTRRN